MYAGDQGPSFSQSTAKSCIQALLKNREQQPTSSKSSTNNSSPDPNYLNNSLGVTPDYTNFGAVPQNFDFLQVPGCPQDNEINSSENLDNQNDFNYSQKLFHIDDGNLYSIFSPIQGRSYGMKPSFLRKQKYTVQECHSRGRKNLRKGLKFHNFLPSESVTSEKDNGYLRNKWKVHSECRLREEHGTKQITISNWSQSVQNSSNEPMNFGKPTVKFDPPSTRARTGNTYRQSTSSKLVNGNQITNNGASGSNVDPYDFSLSLQGNNTFENSKVFNKSSKESTTATSKARDCARSSASKKDSLTFVVNSLLEKPESSENRNLICDTVENHSKSSYQSQKHRRKPVQTRRVVPYVKYLSIMEESESVPLDLSSKCVSEAPVNFHSRREEFQDVLGETDVECNQSSSLINGDPILRYKNDSASGSINTNSSLHVPTSSSDNRFSNSVTLENLLQNQIPTPLMFLSPPQVNNNMNMPPTFLESGVNMPQGFGNISGKLNLGLNTKQIKIKNSFPQSNMNMSHPLTNNAQYTVHKSFVKEPHPRTRRRNQRSVIKQKLEDTFRQNGFLVKTKQVSDGEATFCKFRQLRKYTRYYLKSWQQHLPDEVNKMWKGFLPPKTVLPPVSGASEAANGIP